MSDAAEVIWFSFGGKTFRCSRRTAAHLAFTVERLEADHPSAQIQVIQGCYNTTVEASAGTHDFDACLDVAVVNMAWWAAQRFLRECGWAAFYRYPPTFSHHVHMISLGYPGRVGVYVPGQVADYYNHALGLKGQHNSGSDPSWHPADIDSTIFDYEQWRDAHMPLNDDDLAKVRAIFAEELDKAEERIKYEAPNGQKVAKRKWFEGFRKAVQS